MTTTRLRVAMVGAGMISRHHLDAWRKLAEVDVVAVVDPDPGRASDRAAQFDIGARFESVEALVAGGLAVDALDVASPRETHGPILRFAAARGLACLCQKPFMPTLAEAEAIVGDLAGGPRVMVNQNFRFRPYYQRMRAWIDDGRLGAISGCTIQTRSSGLIPDAGGRYPYIERQPFVRHERRLMIEEVLIHRLDIARWLCGALDLVAARSARSCPALAGESEATVFCATREHGAAVVVDGHFASHGYPALSHDRVEIAGARGRILFEHGVLALHAAQPEEHRYDHAAAYQQSFDATIAHFAGCLASGEPFLTTPEDNLETLRLVESAYRSAAR